MHELQTELLTTVSLCPDTSLCPGFGINISQLQHVAEIRLLDFLFARLLVVVKAKAQTLLWTSLSVSYLCKLLFCQINPHLTGLPCLIKNSPIVICLLKCC